MKTEIEKQFAAHGLNRADLTKYRQWITGQNDRLAGRACASNHGKYLDGYYSPEKTCPDFLLPPEAAFLRRFVAVPK